MAYQKKVWDRKTHRISLSVTKETRDGLDAVAKHSGYTITEWIERAVNRAVRRLK